MEVSLKFKIDNLNNIIVKDITKYEDTPNYSLTGYTKNDSGSIFILGYHNKDNDLEYVAPIYINHHTECSEYKIKVPKDGWITLYLIVLPTKEFVNANYDKIKDSKSYLYYIDNNHVYDKNNLDKEVCIDTLLSINPDVTSVLINELDYISIWNLQKCLVNLCLEIFNNLGAFGKCFNSSSIDDELKYKRDLVWMAINVIKYLTKYNMKAEAARIINQLEGCNGICTLSLTKGIRGCGCGKGSKA